MKFTIIGKIIPYVRMTQRSKYADDRARRYLQSQRSIGWQLKQQMRYAGAEMRAPSGLHRWDLDNGIKAVLDAAQGIVFADDRWIDRLAAERVIDTEYITEMTVEIIEARGDASQWTERSNALTHTNKQSRLIDMRGTRPAMSGVPTPACVAEDESVDALEIVKCTR